jgi:hypothetical protein
VTTDDQDIGQRLRALMGELDRSPLGQRLRDRAMHRRHAHVALLRNPDPTMREIGEQLRDGRMRPADILTVPAYLEAFQRGADRAAQRLDPRELAEQLETMLATVQRNTADDQPTTDHGSDPRQRDRREDR